MDMKPLWILILLLSSTTCLAGTRDPSVPDSKYLEYGKKHQCVLRIAGIYGDKLNTQFKGSCVLIDKYHILTAAHIVSGSITQHVLFEGKAYPCAIVAMHSQYDPEKMGTCDIAIARLQKPIEIDFYPELYKTKDEVGKICSLAGYGFTGTFTTGYTLKNYDNKRRAGSNFVDKIHKNTLAYSVDKGQDTSLEFLISPGDSGGGLFIDKKLAGIHSCVYGTDKAADSDYGDVGCSTRVSDYIEWIEKTKEIIKLIMEDIDVISKKK